MSLSFFIFLEAFFRRSVRNDNYRLFQCNEQGSCSITVASRKNCTYCRIKQCFAIGMNKKWIMTDEEIGALMKVRAEKKLLRQKLVGIY